MGFASVILVALAAFPATALSCIEPEPIDWSVRLPASDAAVIGVIEDLVLIAADDAFGDLSLRVRIIEQTSMAAPTSVRPSSRSDQGRGRRTGRISVTLRIPEVPGWRSCFSQVLEVSGFRSKVFPTASMEPDNRTLGRRVGRVEVAEAIDTAQAWTDNGPVNDRCADN